MAFIAGSCAGHVAHMWHHMCQPWAHCTTSRPLLQVGAVCRRTAAATRGQPAGTIVVTSSTCVVISIFSTAKGPSLSGLIVILDRYLQQPNTC